MIKKIITYLCALMLVISHEQLAKHGQSFILRLAYPPGLSMYGVTAYYKGIPYDLAEGWALIKDDQGPALLSVVIAESLEWKAEGNMVRYLQRLPNKPFLWFDLTLSLKKTGSYAWNIQKRSAQEVPLRLPENTLFVELNPELFETLLTLDQEDCSAKSDLITLPIIQLRKALTQEEFDAKSVYSHLASLDLKTINREPKKIIQAHDPLKISMITLK